MKYMLLIVLVIIISCSQKNKQSTNEYPIEKILGKQYDENRKIRKRVLTGRIPGEDIFLKIQNYDTLGNIIAEYGARAYGGKYRNENKYDTKNRVIETLEYSFTSKNNQYGEFENYSDKWLYEIKDTLVDFGVSDTMVSRKTTYSYNDENKTVREKLYINKFDQISNENKLCLEFDTTYSFEFNEIGR